MRVIRKTKSVALVLDTFRKKDFAISVVKLVETLSDHMNKTTVYRILDRLEQEGLVHSILGKDGLRWYAKCSNCTSQKHSDFHPHFQCNDCGTIQCISADITIPNLPNIQVDSAEIMLTGICSKCNS